jgi:hypothetical protein
MMFVSTINAEGAPVLTVEIGAGVISLKFFATLDNFNRTERTEVYALTPGVFCLRRHPSIQKSEGS